MSISSSLEGSAAGSTIVEGGAGQDGSGRRIEGRSTWQLAWARLRRDRAAMISFGVIVVIVLVAIFAPVFASITGHGANQQFRDIGLSPDGLPKGPGGN